MNFPVIIASDWNSPGENSNRSEKPRRYSGLRYFASAAGCFVAVNLPVKPRTVISPLITVSEVKAPANAKTAGPEFQLQATLLPATVAGVNSPGLPSFSQVALIPPPSAL